MTPSPDLEDLRKVVFANSQRIAGDRLLAFLTSPEAREQLAREAYRGRVDDGTDSPPDEDFDALWQHILTADHSPHPEGGLRVNPLVHDRAEAFQGADFVLKLLARVALGRAG